MHTDCWEDKNTVTVTILNCTEEKIALFKEKVLDCEQLVFENFTVDQFDWPTEPDREVDWGLTMSAKDVTSTGLTLVFNQSGGNPKEDLFTISQYHLCVLQDGVWSNVEYTEYVYGWMSIEEILDMGDLLRDGVVKNIEMNGTTEVAVEWDGLYGKLPEGTYRIGRKVCNREAESDDIEETYFFTEFVVEEEKWTNWYERGSELYKNAFNADLLGTAGRIPIYKFETLAEFEQFRDDFVDELVMNSGANDSAFRDAVKIMNEEYFAKYTVFVVYAASQSSSWEYDMTSIDKTDFKLSIHVEQVNRPETLEDDKAGYFLIIPFEKSEVEGIRSFDAYLDNPKWYFQGVVNKIEENTMILSELDENGNVISGSVVRTRKWFYPEWELQEGDKVTVVYDGAILMTSPGQFGTIYEVFFVDANGEVVSVVPED